METKTKLIIIYGGIFIVLIVFIFVWLVISKKSISPIQNTIPTVTPVVTQSIPLQVIQSNPSEGSVVDPSITSISFTFDREISLNSVPVTFIPTPNFTTTVDGSTLTIHPSSLIPGENYEIRLKLNGLNDYTNIYSLHFSTTGPTPTSQPNTYDPKLQHAIQIDLITNHPDVFLAGKVPYSGSDFSATTDFVTGTPSGHWHFTVQTIGSDSTQAKNDFISWAESLGLTSNQINGLDITYQ